MDTDDEAEREDRRTSLYLALVFAAVIVFVLIFGVIVVATIYYFAPSFIQNEIRPRNDKDLTARKIHKKFDMVLVKERLNFTDAYIHCIKVLNGWSLIFPRSVQEENLIQKHLNVEMTRDSSLLESDCGNLIFIGLRRTIDKMWILPNGEDGNLMMGHSRNITESKCTQIYYDKNVTVLEAANCEGSQWACFICEYKCKLRGTCFKPYEGVAVTNFDQAAHFCRSAKKKGELLSVNSLSKFPFVHEDIKSHVKKCQIFGIGNKVSLQYESPSEEKLSYKSKRLELIGKIFDDANCIAINLDKEYNWEAVKCARGHCFMCKDDNVPDYSDDSRL